MPRMIHHLRNDQLRVNVRATGAELASLQTVADGHEYLWQPDPRWWDAQAPVLFPIINRWPGDQYLADGRLYPMPFHGFARLMGFAVTEQAADRLALVLAANDRTREFFPYRFELRAAASGVQRGPAKFPVAVRAARAVPPVRPAPRTIHGRVRAVPRPDRHD
jgi:galactose mutarotase-like enzyme